MACRSTILDNISFTVYPPGSKVSMRLEICDRQVWGIISMKNRIRVLIADDCTIFRKGLSALLASAEDIEVVGEAVSGREAVAAVRHLRPDVVVMEILLPNPYGVEATREIKTQHPSIKVLILTTQKKDRYVSRALEAGASGYILKEAMLDELLTAIRSVHHGGVYLYPPIAAQLVQEHLAYVAKDGTSDDRRLTGREREILGLIAEGNTNREIARMLGISFNTVRVHRSSLMKKIECHNRTEIVKYAIRKGLIAP